MAGFLGGFVSTLASNGSSVTLPALEFLGLPDHAANGTNRLSVVALGLVATASFWREGLIDWRSGARIAVTIALGALAGSFIAVELSDAFWTPRSSPDFSSSSCCSSCTRVAGSVREK